MARLATAYLHLDIQQSPFDRGKFGEALGEIARSIAQEVYRSPIEITVQVEEGSTRVWITVFGVLYAVYGGVAKYPDFREGVVRWSRMGDGSLGTSTTASFATLHDRTE